MSSARTYGRGCSGLGRPIPEDKTLCVSSVPDGMNFPTFYQCKKKRGHGPKGEYCKVHDPDAVEARGKARHARIMAPLLRSQQMANELVRLRRKVTQLERENDELRTRRV